MGVMRDYICPDCGYTAEVCGGTEAGMRTILKTYSCQECKILFDISMADLVGDFEKFLFMDDIEENELRPICPKCKKDKIALWVKEDPICPACRGMMRTGNIETMWD